MLFVLENDGHNTPTMHKFKDFTQVCEYLGEEFRAENQEEDWFGEWQDDNCVLWTNFGNTPELHLCDHTEDEYTAATCDICGGQYEDVIDGVCGECGRIEPTMCDACGERDARGEERPSDECECECHNDEEE